MIHDHPQPEKEIIVTIGKDVYITPVREPLGLAPCNHEEADLRVLLHAADCARQGHLNVMIRVNDTDVFMIAIAKFQHLGLNELWLAYGTGKHYRRTAIHSIATQIGDTKASALPFFHSVTGCDTT